jgi:hypothetical protein
MDPILHWVDAGNESDAIAAGVLLGMGLLYFQIRRWQARRKRLRELHSDPKSHIDRSSVSH